MNFCERARRPSSGRDEELARSSKFPVTWLVRPPHSRYFQPLFCSVSRGVAAATSLGRVGVEEHAADDGDGLYLRVSAVEASVEWYAACFGQRHTFIGLEPSSRPASILSGVLRMSTYVREKYRVYCLSVFRHF